MTVICTLCKYWCLTRLWTINHTELHFSAKFRRICSQDNIWRGLPVVHLWEVQACSNPRRVNRGCSKKTLGYLCEDLKTRLIDCKTILKTPGFFPCFLNCFLSYCSMCTGALTGCWRPLCITYFSSISHIWSPVSLHSVLLMVNLWITLTGARWRQCGIIVMVQSNSFCKCSARKRHIWQKNCSVSSTFAGVRELPSSNNGCLRENKSSADISHRLFVSIVSSSIVFIPSVRPGENSFISWEIDRLEMLYLAQSLNLIIAHSFPICLFVGKGAVSFLLLLTDLERYQWGHRGFCNVDVMV